MYELFQAFICANNIGSLVNNLFGVKIFNSVPSYFWGFNFTLSAILSWGSTFTFSSSPSSGGIGGKSSDSSSFSDYIL